jgi:alginate biosynthesis protein AlgX
VTGANVQNHAIPGGGAFGSISAYMTSDAFQQARPAILIWENPVYNNLAQYGDQPMRELTAAGGGSCRLQIPVISSLDGNAVRADLSGLDPMQEYTLQIDTGGSAASMAQFTFTSPTGATRTSTVTRRTEQEKTGRFYVPVSGLWREGIRSLDIQLNASMAGTPRITACFY